MWPFAIRLEGDNFCTRQYTGTANDGTQIAEGPSTSEPPRYVCGAPSDRTGLAIWSTTSEGRPTTIDSFLFLPPDDPGPGVAEGLHRETDGAWSALASTGPGRPLERTPVRAVWFRRSDVEAVGAC